MKRSPSYSAANDKVTEMNTLTACLNKAVKDGYLETFTATKKGISTQSSPDKVYGPEEVHIDNFYRFEGDSDPGDMSILYVLHTTDGVKGTLLDAYGTYADTRLNDFIVQVEDMHKKVSKETKTGEIPDESPDV